ncbi:MAG: response regulator transcription factor [Candidatus Cloacimonetes bacterium]|nr:response regulator transcription factor [Candidatus Cloacimonadota bacterium]NCC81983.1 response regulator transcription factor [Clostridia bacterium]
MYRILIVDDEEKIRALIKKYTDFEGYESKIATNGMNALEILKIETFDIIIMDIMMPELDGFSTVKEIKKIIDIPIIMLSARGEEYDKIHGFELGIDDYVVKPFAPKELMMRIEAVMNRYNKYKKEKREIWQKDTLLIDVTARTVTINEKKIQMSPKEYDLLFYFLKNKNIALTREQLITEVWGYDYIGDDRTLDTHVKLLRKSLENYSDLIVTLRGVGYRFEG